MKKIKKVFVLAIVCFFMIQFNAFTKDKIDNNYGDFRLNFSINEENVHYIFTNNYFEYYDNTDFIKINFNVINELTDALEIKYTARINSHYYTWTMFIKKDFSESYIENGVADFNEFIVNLENLISKNQSFSDSVDHLAQLFDINQSSFTSKTKKITTTERILCTIGTVGAYCVGGPITAIIYNGICLALADLS